MKTAIFKTNGMSCSHCENRLKAAIVLQEGIENCEANSNDGIVKVDFDENKIIIDKIAHQIEELGFDVI